MWWVERGREERRFRRKQINYKEERKCEKAKYIYFFKKKWSGWRDSFLGHDGSDGDDNGRNNADANGEASNNVLREEFRGLWGKITSLSFFVTIFINKTIKIIVFFKFGEKQLIGLIHL